MTEVQPLSPARLLLALLAIGLITFTAVLYVNRDGVITGNDSARYLGLPENIADGRGATVPSVDVLHGFSPREALERVGSAPSVGLPPLYGVALTPWAAFGSGARAGVPIVNAVGIAAFMMMAAWVTYYMSGGSRAAPIILLALTLTQLDFLTTTRFPQPENLFMPLALGSLLLVWRFLRTPSTTTFVWLCVASAAALLTRHLALAVVATVVLVLFGLFQAPLKRRLTYTAIFLAASLTPLLVFTILSRDPASGGGFTNLGFHPPGSRDVELFIGIVHRWLADLFSSSQWRITVSIGGLGALGLGIWGWTRTPSGADDPIDDRGSRQLLTILGLFVLLYLMALFFASTFVDDDVEFGGRFLIPIHPIVLAIVLAGIARFVHALPVKKRVPVGAALCLASALAVIGLGRGTWDLMGPIEASSHDRLRDSASADFVAGLSDDTYVFTNNEATAYLSTDRAAMIVPSVINRYTGKANPDFEAEMAELAQLTDEVDLVIVYYKGTFRDYLVTQAELERRLGLEVLDDLPEAVILAPTP